MFTVFAAVVAVVDCYFFVESDHSWCHSDEAMYDHHPSTKSSLARHLTKLQAVTKDMCISSLLNSFVYISHFHHWLGVKCDINMGFGSPKYCLPYINSSWY